MATYDENSTFQLTADMKVAQELRSEIRSQIDDLRVRESRLKALENELRKQLGEDVSSHKNVVQFKRPKVEQSHEN